MGWGGAVIRRVTVQGPTQHGDTDVGYRLNPRELELEIGFRASTDSALDAHRDTLMSIFKPLTSTPVYLRATRDDGEIRQLDCYTVGDIKIGLLSEHRPGHYHRATVKLRAPDPAYYGITPGTVTASGAGTAVAADWYLAGGLIGTAQVLMSGGTPTQGQAWSYTGTVPGTSSFTLALRMPFEGTAAVGSAKYAYNVPGSIGDGLPNVNFGVNNSYYFAYDSQSYGTALMSAGTTNYYYRYNYNGLEGVPAFRNRIEKDVGDHREAYTVAGADGTVAIAGTPRVWRAQAAGSVSTYWGGSIIRYALYSPDLSESQLDALGIFMSGAIGGTIIQTLLVPYAGDLPEYPTISVRGPITGLRMFNALTHHLIDLGTTVIANGETYQFDLRPGYKTVTLGTVNKRSTLASYSDWDEFHLTSYIGGENNSIVVTGTNTSGSTQISLVWYNRYASI